MPKGGSARAASATETFSFTHPHLATKARGPLRLNGIEGGLTLRMHHSGQAIAHDPAGLANEVPMYRLVRLLA